MILRVPYWKPNGKELFQSTYAASKWLKCDIFPWNRRRISYDTLRRPITIDVLNFVQNTIRTSWGRGMVLGVINSYFFKKKKIPKCTFFFRPHRSRSKVITFVKMLSWKHKRMKVSRDGYWVFNKYLKWPNCELSVKETLWNDIDNLITKIILSDSSKYVAFIFIVQILQQDIDPA